MANPVGRPKLSPDAPRVWNEKELALIELLADPLDRRTKKQKSEAVGHHETWVFECQKRPAFVAEVRRRMQENVGANLPAVYSRLLGIALNAPPKDALRACELLLKAVGDILPGGVAIQQTVVGSEQTLVRTLQGRPRMELAAMLKDELERLTEFQVAVDENKNGNDELPDTD